MRRALSVAFTAVSLAGCGDDLSNPYAATAQGSVVFADRAVVHHDGGLARLTVVVPTLAGGIARTHVALRSPALRIESSADGARVFVLTQGIEKSRTRQAVAPELLVISVEGEAVASKSYPLPVGFGNIVADPEGAYVALVPGAVASSSVVSNPNALALVKLDAPPSAQNPVVRSATRANTVAAPLVFSPTLTTPRGAKRFLVAIGPREVALVDLAAAFVAEAAPDLTIPLTSAGATSTLVPSKLRFDDGEPSATDDARLAFALANDTSLLTATIASNESPAAGESSLRAVVNLTDVGADVSDLAFVATPEGRRIAVLTPWRQRAILADPQTSLTTSVPMPYAYDSLRVMPGATTSTIMLAQHRGANGAVALWDIPKTANQPYRAVETIVDVSSLEAVIPVPGSETKFLVQSASATELILLDVATRERKSITAPTLGRIVLAKDGQRLYIAPRFGDVSCATVSLANLTSWSFAAGSSVAGLGEIRRSDGSPVILLTHGNAQEGLTLFDPTRPEALGARWDDALVEGVR